jgi:hypothetical protein
MLNETRGLSDSLKYLPKYVLLVLYSAATSKTLAPSLLDGIPRGGAGDRGLY